MIHIYIGHLQGVLERPIYSWIRAPLDPSPEARLSSIDMSSCKVAIKQSTAISSKEKNNESINLQQSILLKWGEFLPKTQFNKAL